MSRVSPHQIDAHEDDVNAVAFADSSSQLLFSGSDDALCKVWDRRTLREDRPQPVGQLAGHRDGITFIHSKVRKTLLVLIRLIMSQSYPRTHVFSQRLRGLWCFQGDARYLISNSKDQSIKLWDVRKFSPKEGLAASRLAVTQQNWDYRWQQVPQRGEKEEGRREAEGGVGGGVLKTCVCSESNDRFIITNWRGGGREEEERKMIGGEELKKDKRIKRWS